LTVGAKVVSRDALDEVLQHLLVARLLALAQCRGHGGCSAGLCCPRMRMAACGKMSTRGSGSLCVMDGGLGGRADGTHATVPPEAKDQGSLIRGTTGGGDANSLINGACRPQTQPPGTVGSFRFDSFPGKFDGKRTMHTWIRSQPQSWRGAQLRPKPWVGAHPSLPCLLRACSSPARLAQGASLVSVGCNVDGFDGSRPSSVSNAGVYSTVCMTCHNLKVIVTHSFATTQKSCT